MKRTFMNIVCSSSLKTFYSVYMMVTLFSCIGSIKNNQATYIDTSTALVSADTINSHISAKEYKTRAIKVVYVLPGSGVEIRYEMDLNSGTGSMIPFAQPLEVIKEYTEWYQVRTNYNYYTRIFYIPIESTSSESPIALRLFYTAFEACIKGFGFEGMEYHSDIDTSASVYPYYKEDYNGPPALRVKADTLYLTDESYRSNTRDRIQIISQNAEDHFRVSYAYMQQSYETIDERSTIYEDNYSYQSLFELTPYTMVSDSSGYYNLPKTFSESKSNQHVKAYMKAFKKKYQLRDTSVVISGEGDWGPYVVHAVFTRNKKLFQYSVSEDLYIRIERIVKGEIKETKYIIFRPEGGC